MAKVSIKAKPTFNAEVSIPRPGSDPLKIVAVFRHRTKKELASFLEQSRGCEDLDITMGMLDGWVDVEEEFSRDAVEGLLEDFYGAADAFAFAYVRELQKARSGN